MDLERTVAEVVEHRLVQKIGKIRPRLLQSRAQHIKPMEGLGPGGDNIAFGPNDMSEIKSGTINAWLPLGAQVSQSVKSVSLHSVSQ